MLERIFDGFVNILLLAAFFTCFFIAVAGLFYSSTHFGYFNLIWIIPGFLLMCYIFGDDYD